MAKNTEKLLGSLQLEIDTSFSYLLLHTVSMVSFALLNQWFVRKDYPFILLSSDCSVLTCSFSPRNSQMSQTINHCHVCYRIKHTF